MKTISKEKLKDKLSDNCSDYACTASPTAAKKLEDSGFTNV